MGNGTTHSNGFTSVNIDSTAKQMFITDFYDSNTGKEPIVMPCMRVYDYLLSKQVYEDYCFNGHDFRNDSNQYCNGDVADSRALFVRNYNVNGTDYLYYIGRSDGGDSMYYCQSKSPENMNEKVNITSIDGYTNPYNMNGAAPISFIGQLDSKTGLVNYGQMQLTRTGEGKGNGLETLALDVDKYGYVYEAQYASCCIDNRGNLTVNNQRVGNYSGSPDGLLLVLTPDFKERLYWTPFSSYEGGKKSKPVDIKVNNGRVVFAVLANGEMITKNSFSGTKASSNDTVFVGYLSVFGTVENQ